jgi:hypothetical protein
MISGIVGIRVTNAMTAKTLKETAIIAPMHRPTNHMMIGRVMNRTTASLAEKWVVYVLQYITAAEVKISHDSFHHEEPAKGNGKDYNHTHRLDKRHPILH